MHPLRPTIAIMAAILFAPLVFAQAPATTQQSPPTQQGAPTQQGGAATAERGRGPALPANQPAAPRTPARHEGFLEIAKAGNIDLLFVGDSITDLWPRRGKDTWDEHWVPLKVANFGISGDTTQGVLWRMQNGELEGFKAKLIILMLGTNNINWNPNDEIVEGDRLIVEEFKKRQPQAKVLVLGIFPRAADAASPFRA